MNHPHESGYFSIARSRSDGNRREELGEEAVIDLSGRLDMNTSPNLRKTALKLYLKGQCKNLRIDFANVSYIDTFWACQKLCLRFCSTSRERTMCAAHFMQSERGRSVSDRRQRAGGIFQD